MDRIIPSNTNEDREFRIGNIRPLNKDIKDLRLYLHFDLKPKQFYLNQAADIYLQHLIWNDLKCPDYNHIYIYTGESKEDCITAILTPESWHAGGIAKLNEDEFHNATNEQKESLIFDTLDQGLRDIANIDHLNKDIVEQTIQEVRNVGFNHEFVACQKENKRYTAAVTYKCLRDGFRVQPFLHIENKETGDMAIKKLEESNSYSIPWWAQNLTVTNKEIRIKSSKSVRAEVWLNGMKPNPVYLIEELFETKNANNG